MSSKLNRASALAVAATMIATLASADGSGASAQAMDPVAVTSEPATQFTAEPVIQQLPKQQLNVDPAVQDESTPISEDSLAALVPAASVPAEMSRELNCLAGAIYFEAKSESLPGQLAVGRVVVARSK